MNINLWRKWKLLLIIEYYKCFRFPHWISIYAEYCKLAIISKLEQSLIFSPWLFIGGVAIECDVKKIRKYSCLVLWSYQIPCTLVTTSKKTVCLASSSVQLGLLQAQGYNKCFILSVFCLLKCIARKRHPI